MLYGLADRNPEAASALERAVRIDPERADAFALLTIAYIKPKFCGPMREIPCNDGTNFGFGSVVYWVRLVKVGG